MRRSLLALASLVAIELAEAAERTCFVGTYAKDDSEGIYALRVDDETGSLTAPVLAARAANASFLVVDAQRHTVLTYQETGRDTPLLSACMVSYAIESNGCSLVERNRQPLDKHAPCHVALDPTGRWLVGANYADGDVHVFPVDATGRLGPRTGKAQLEGSGPHPRQRAPHAHQIVFEPSGHSFLVPDLGSDRVPRFTLDQSGIPQLAAPDAIRASPGDGPRHLAFHPTRPFVFVVNELANTVTTYQPDRPDGSWTRCGVTTTLPAGWTNANTASEIAIHPSGTTLYVSNRGHDSIAMFGIGEMGQLSERGHVPSGGKTPRHFAIVPSGRYLLAANQESGSICVFRIEADGRLAVTPIRVAVPSPSCIAF